MKTYEVTVPVTVTVTMSSKRGNTVTAAVVDGYPGFHSEAEEAAGAWNPKTSEWDESTHAWEAACWARALVRWTLAGLAGEHAGGAS